MPLDLDPEMLASYIEAARLIQIDIQTKVDEGYERLVIPSRGASPLARLAWDYFHQSQSLVPNPASFTQRLRNSGPLLRPFYLPFTAEAPDGSTIDTSSIRRFWVYVLAAIVRSDYNDVYYRFWHFLNRWSDRFSRAETPDFPSERFVFLDTVISGQSIVEIINAFDEKGLVDAHFILIADNYGESIKPQYRRRISEMEYRGRATLIKVKRLFTEDQGPAMSGIWTVGFPQMLLSASKLIPMFERDKAVGAGFYWLGVGPELDEKRYFAISNSILSTLLSTALRSDIDKFGLADFFCRQLRTIYREGRLGHEDTTVAMATPALKTCFPSLISVTASSSHALRGMFADNECDAFIKRFIEENPDAGR